MKSNALLLALATSAPGLEPLQQGPGLARNFPVDRRLTEHPSILLVEDSEGESLDDLKPRWNENENKDGEVLDLVADHPEDSAGKQCLQVTATLGEKAGEEAREWKATLPLPKVDVTGLTLALRVIHPLPNGKPLRFANAGQDRDAPGWLSLGLLP